MRRARSHTTYCVMTMLAAAVAAALASAADTVLFVGAPATSPQDAHQRLDRMPRGACGAYDGCSVIAGAGQTRRSGRCAGRRLAAGLRGSAALRRASSPIELDVDDALSRTYGSGLYQGFVFLFVGVGLYSMQFPFQIMSIYTDVKMAADTSFSMESLSLASSVLFFGWLLGAVVVGPLTDSLGRKPVMFGGGVGLILSGLGAVLAPTLGGDAAFPLFLLAKLLMGVFIAAGPVASLYVQESIPGELRGKAMAALNAAYSLTAALQAYLCGSVTFALDWRAECLLWYLPALAGVAFGLPLLGESLRFLVSREGKSDEADEVLARIAKTNGVAASVEGVRVVASSPPSALSGEEVGEAAGGEEEGLMSPRLLPRVMSLMFCFAACSVTSYGLAFSAGSLSPDLYQNSMLFNLVDLVGYVISLAVDTFGRKATQGTCFFGAGLCLLLCGVFEAGTWPVVACALAGRLFVSACFTVVYILVVELFPTSARSGALGACCVAARAGGLFAPLARSLPASVSCPTFGVVCVIAALLTFQLPETAGKKLE